MFMPYRNKEAQKKHAREYYLKNRRKFIEGNAERRRKNPFIFDCRNLISRFKMRYGISIKLEDYLKLFEEAHGVCAICKVEWKTGRRMAIDHCHKTNRLRGFLCDKCNMGMGLFRDDKDILESAIEYIKKYENQV